MQKTSQSCSSSRTEGSERICTVSDQPVWGLPQVDSDCCVLCFMFTLLLLLNFQVKTFRVPHTHLGAVCVQFSGCVYLSVWSFLSGIQDHAVLTSLLFIMASYPLLGTEWFVSIWNWQNYHHSTVLNHFTQTEEFLQCLAQVHPNCSSKDCFALPLDHSTSTCVSTGQWLSFTWAQDVFTFDSLLHEKCKLAGWSWVGLGWGSWIVVLSFWITIQDCGLLYHGLGFSFTIIAPLLPRQHIVESLWSYVASA